MTQGVAHILRLGAALDALDAKALDGLGKAVAGVRGYSMSDLLSSYLRDVIRLAGPHAEMELRSRSYVGSKAPLFEDAMSDEYHDYLVDLSGIAQDEIRQKAQDILEDSAKKGLSVNETAKILGRLFTNMTQGRLRTIVRTESGRVMNKTRDDVLQRALESGGGPDYLLYSAILDNRTTDTCTFGHDHYSVAQSNEVWNQSILPAHWNCRSIRRFIYEGDPELEGELTPWNQREWNAYRAIQEREFPNWRMS